MTTHPIHETSADELSRRLFDATLGTGTVMRQENLADYARQAGFSGVEVLPIETDLWRFYHLV